MTVGHNPLWSDEPTGRDLLSFVAVAQTVADAVLDERLDPIALGVSGAWGSGKTSVLELVKQEIKQRADAAQTRVLVVQRSRGATTPGSGRRRA